MDSDYEPEEDINSALDEEDDVAFEDDDDWSDSERKEEKSSKRNKRTSLKKSKTAPKQQKRSSEPKNRKTSKMSISTISPEYLADIKRTFERFDTENKGRVEFNQLKFAMRALGFEPRKEQIKQISEEFNKDGFITYDDFFQLMSKKIIEKTTDDEILKAFQLFDTEQNGKITFEDLKRVAKELGEKITDDEINEMIDEADLDGDKAVDCQEFLRIMKKTFLY